MTSIYLVGEGPTDCGKESYNKKTSQNIWLDGPIQVLIKKITQNVNIETKNKTEVLELKFRRSSRERRVSLHGHAKKAYNLCLMTINENIDNVLCYVDCDFKRNINLQQKFNDIYQEIIDGYSKFDSIFNESIGSNSIPIVPIKMIESWLLSDDNAFLKAFGKKPTSPCLPKEPEKIWGQKQNPTSNYPKNYLLRVLSQYNEEYSRETFIKIAENIDINTIKKKCPISFKKFYDDLIRIIPKRC